MTVMLNRPFVRTIGALAVALALTGPAAAGPPLICHPFEVGNAAVLPWGNAVAWNSPDASYDRAHLVADTLRLLTAEAPILARMENLRRATIYASQDAGIAAHLLIRVLGRTLSAAADGRGDPFVWFDAGYLIETMRQAAHLYQWDMLSGREKEAWTLRTELAGLDGYALVRKALSLAELSSRPEMDFAASLMRGGAEAAAHRQRASAAAAAGSLLARNLRP